MRPMQSKLFKRGQINTKYKERWFVLNELTLQLEYHDTEQSQYALGTIALSDVYAIHTSLNTTDPPDYVVQNCKNNSGKQYTFELITSFRTYVLATDHYVLCSQWVNELSRVIFGEVIYDGVLRKLGKVHKVWRTRYFVLNKYKQIKYYPTKKRVQLLGTITVDSQIAPMTQEHHTYGLGFDHVFQIVTKKRTWKLCAPTKGEKNNWIQHIKALINDTNNSVTQRNSLSLLQSQTSDINTPLNQMQQDKPKWVARVRSINNQNQLLFQDFVNGGFTTEKPAAFRDPNNKWMATLTPNGMMGCSDYQYRNIETQQVQWTAPKCFDLNVSNPPPFNPNAAHHKYSQYEPVVPTAPAMVDYRAVRCSNAYDTDYKQQEPGVIRQPTVVRQRKELNNLRRERESLLIENSLLKGAAEDVKATYYAKESENKNLKQIAKQKEIENRKLQKEKQDALNRNKQIQKEKEKLKKQAKEIEKEVKEKEKEKQELLHEVGVNVVWKWKGDDGVFNAYDKAISENVEMLKIGQAHAFTDEHKYIIRRKTKNTATQKNHKTGTTRRVQRSIERGKYHTIWQWKGDNTIWSNYDPMTSKKIEQLTIGNSSTFTFGSNERKYVITKQSTSAGEQTNSATNFQRDVRRICTFEQMKMDRANNKSKTRYPKWWSISLKAKRNHYGDVKLVSLNMFSDPAAQRVIQTFKRTVSNKEIIKIESVENQMLYDKFWNERNTMKKLIGQSKINEQWLFHGTGNEDIMNTITKEGFRKEFNTTALHGKGTYFARDASYSVGYSSKDKYGIHKMFQCVVICGESIQGKGAYELRTWPKKASNGLIYDTLVDSKANPSIYVIHENARAYPMFVIHFQNKQKNDGFDWGF
eukprot:30206_1